MANLRGLAGVFNVWPEADQQQRQEMLGQVKQYMQIAATGTQLQTVRQAGQIAATQEQRTAQKFETEQQLRPEELRVGLETQQATLDRMGIENQELRKRIASQDEIIGGIRREFGATPGMITARQHAGTALLDIEKIEELRTRHVPTLDAEIESLLKQSQKEIALAQLRPGYSRDMAEGQLLKLYAEINKLNLAVNQAKTGGKAPEEYVLELLDKIGSTVKAIDAIKTSPTLAEAVGLLPDSVVLMNLAPHLTSGEAALLLTDHLNVLINVFTKVSKTPYSQLSAQQFADPSLIPLNEELFQQIPIVAPTQPQRQIQPPSLTVPPTPTTPPADTTAPGQPPDLYNAFNGLDLIRRLEAGQTQE